MSKVGGFVFVGQLIRCPECKKDIGQTAPRYARNDVVAALRGGTTNPQVPDTTRVQFAAILCPHCNVALPPMHGQNTGVRISEDFFHIPVESIHDWKDQAGHIFTAWDLFMSIQDQPAIPPLEFDTVNQRIHATSNTPFVVGKLSDFTTDNYLHDVTFSLGGRIDWDDDPIGVVIAAKIVGNVHHILAAWRCPNHHQPWLGWGGMTGQGDSSTPRVTTEGSQWFIAYNAWMESDTGHGVFNPQNPPAQVIRNGDMQLTWLTGGTQSIVPNGTVFEPRDNQVFDLLTPNGGSHMNVAWHFYPRGTRVRIRRNRNIITAHCSLFNEPDTLHPESILEFDMEDYPCLSELLGPQQIGYGAISQMHATWVDAEFVDLSQGSIELQRDNIGTTHPNLHRRVKWCQCQDDWFCQTHKYIHNDYCKYCDRRLHEVHQISCELYDEGNTVLPIELHCAIDQDGNYECQYRGHCDCRPHVPCDCRPYDELKVVCNCKGDCNCDRNRPLYDMPPEQLFDGSPRRPRRDTPRRRPNESYKVGIHGSDSIATTEIALHHEEQTDREVP